MVLSEREQILFDLIEQDLRMQKEILGSRPELYLGGTSESQVYPRAEKFVSADGTLNREAVRNFRNLEIFIADIPSRRNPPEFRTASKILPQERKELLLLYKIFKEVSFGGVGVLDLLREYPCDSVGSPILFSCNGYTFTKKWLIRVYFLLLFRYYVLPGLEKNFTLIDVGGNYGYFSALIKRDNPCCCQILLDFPEPLALAHYYLQTLFPEAKISSYQTIAGMKSIDRDFIMAHDFVLLPPFLYERLQTGSVDVFSGISSLGEMSREWFEYYFRSQVFSSARYFFCMHNQVRSSRYDTDLTIRDYHLHDFKKLFFRISPEVFPEEEVRSPYFEFIGERVYR